VALLVKLFEMLLGAAMSPSVLPLLRAAVRSIMSDELINAPDRGQADEEFKSKIEASGMADVPLFGKHPDA